MKKGPDIFSGNLFEGENESTPQLLNIKNTPEGQKIVDEEGNEYTDQGQLKKKKYSEELETALREVREAHRKLNDGISPEDILPSDPEVQFYVRQARQRKKN